MDDALPTVGMTMRFLALCDLYGSHRAAVGLVARLIAVDRNAGIDREPCRCASRPSG